MSHNILSQADPESVTFLKSNDTRICLLLEVHVVISYCSRYIVVYIINVMIKQFYGNILFLYSLKTSVFLTFADGIETKHEKNNE